MIDGMGMGMGYSLALLGESMGKRIGNEDGDIASLCSDG
jgi:hypothetical protein